jgi:hypothetical protein
MQYRAPQIVPQLNCIILFQGGAKRFHTALLSEDDLKVLNMGINAVTPQMKTLHTCLMNGIGALIDIHREVEKLRPVAIGAEEDEVHEALT